MRRFTVLITTLAVTMSGLVISSAQADAGLGLSLAFAPTAQAKAKVTKPSAPTIAAISSSAVKKGKVNVKVTITLPASNGGSKITGSKVTAGGKSCTIEKTKTSCTIKSIKNGKSLSVYANSKNIKGFSAKSARVTYAAGASPWSTSPAAPAAPAVSPVADAPAAAAPAPAAVTSPGAPTNVLATNASSPSVVSWTAPESNGGAAITSYTVTSTPGSVTCSTASSPCEVTGLTNGTTYTFTVTATNTAGTGTASTASSSVIPATCANGGTCVVGNTGPGGGIVYYVDTAGFNCGSGFTATGSPTGGECNYLEVAPSGWNTGTDPAKPWATGTSTSGNAIADVTGITNEISANNSSTGIGLGYKNSDLIKTQNGTYDATSNNYAAGAARAYAGNSKSDWYLPTTAELNLLCQWGRNVTQAVGTACTGGTINTGTGVNGGFTSIYYWSSSEFGADGAWSQTFDTGDQSLGQKNPNWRVRPVRAF